MKEEALLKLQEVMKEAGELKNIAPFSELVDNKFAEEAIKKQSDIAVQYLETLT